MNLLQIENHRSERNSDAVYLIKISMLMTFELYYYNHYEIISNYSFTHYMYNIS